MAKRVEGYSEFSDADILEQSIAIVQDFERRGFALTLRALYYQLVGAGIISNLPDQKSYNKIKADLARARDRGAFPLRALLDKGRHIGGDSEVQTSLDVDGTIRALEIACRNGSQYIKVAKQYKAPVFCFALVEKDAAENYLQAYCVENGIPLIPLRGYPSFGIVTQILDLMHRLLSEGTGRRGFRLLYIGDHDPDGMEIPKTLLGNIVSQLGVGGDNGLGDDSGWDALRSANIFWPACEDVEFISLSKRYEDYGPRIRLERLGLTLEQAQALDLPPFPAKESSARFQRYYDEFGEDAWEMDALSPENMIELIKNRFDEIQEESTAPQQAQQLLEDTRKDFDERWRVRMLEVAQDMNGAKR